MLKVENKQPWFVSKGFLYAVAVCLISTLLLFFHFLYFPDGEGQTLILFFVAVAGVAHFFFMTEVIKIDGKSKFFLMSNIPVAIVAFLFMYFVYPYPYPDNSVRWFDYGAWGPLNYFSWYVGLTMLLFFSSPPRNVLKSIPGAVGIHASLMYFGLFRISCGPFCDIGVYIEVFLFSGAYILLSLISYFLILPFMKNKGSKNI